jgi:hypothetical protein
MSGLKLSDLDPNEIEIIPGGENEAKYGGVGQQALGALESFGSAATFGLSKGLERALGVNPEDIRGREEALNPLLNIGASAAGLISTGVGGALVKGGGLAARALGLGAAESLAGKLGAGAVKGFVEGALFQGGNEVGKMLLSDPHQTVGTAAASMGLAGLIGAPFGAAGEGARALWKAKVGNKVQASLEKAIQETGEQAPVLSEGIDLSGLKPNATSIADSAKRLGVDVSAGTLSDSSLIQSMEGNLARRPTIAGAMQDKAYKKTSDALIKASKETLGEATDKTAYQVGKELKDGLIESLEKKLAPIEKSYGELRPTLKKIEVSPELKQTLSDSIKASPELSYSKALRKEADELVENLANVKNLDELKNFGTDVNSRLAKASSPLAGDAQQASFLQNVKNAAKEIRDASLSASQFNEKVGPELFGKVVATDAEYSAYKTLLRELGVEGGFGKTGTARGLLEKFKSLPNESFSRNRIFDPQDYDALKFFQQNFPEQFDLAKRFKLAGILEKSISQGQGKNGQFEVGSFLRQISDSKMGPEVREMLFGPEGVKKILDVKNIYQAMPGNPNPSGTSYAEAFGKLFSPEGVMQNVTDAAQAAFLKAQPHLLSAMGALGKGGDEASALGMLQFLRGAEAGIDSTALKQSVDFISKVVKGEKDLSKAARGIFDSVGPVISSSLVPSVDDDERLEKMLARLQLDPMPGAVAAEDVGSYMPNEAGALSEVGMNAVNYLNSLRPEVTPQTPLDAPLEPNAVEKATYRRALQIANQPLIVLQKLKDGSITSQDITHLKNLYPGLYDRMASKILNEMTTHLSKQEKIPYKTKIGLSVFLGQPLDQTMMSQSIMAAQPKGPSQNPMQQRAPTARGSFKDLGKISSQVMTPQQARIQSRSTPN